MVSGCIVIAFLLDSGVGVGVCVCVALSFLCFACLIPEQSWCEHTLWCGIGIYLVCYVIACSSNCVINFI